MLRKNQQRFTALMQRYNTDYFFTERYLQRKLCPVISISDIPNLMQRKDALQIVQRIYTSIMVKAYHIRLRELVTASTTTRQVLAIEASVLHALGHGDCGELTSRLVLDLIMTDEFPLISKYVINPYSKDNHAFVVVEDVNGDELVLDPYFNLCCPLIDYPKQSCVLDYFRAIIPGWEFPKELSSIMYKREDYQSLRATLLADFKALCQIRHPDLEKYKASFARFSELRSQPFSFERVKPFLMECFMESVRLEGENISSLQIEHMIDPAAVKLPKRFAEIALFATDIRTSIVSDIKRVTGSVGYKNLHECLDLGLKETGGASFSRALRIACTGTGDKAYLVVKRLLEDKSILCLNVNEQAGAKAKAAIHYALEKGDERIISLLIEHGASKKLQDSDGHSAEKYFQLSAKNKR